MREHPIPQDITGYRFHIIGNMTIKQFAQLGAGCFVGFLIYTTNLFDLLKWTLIGGSIGLGALVAFVPFEERPLDHWLVTFIGILYKPTKFYWKKMARVPEPFMYKPSETTKEVEEVFDFSGIRRERIQEYLSSVNRHGDAMGDQYDQIRSSRINSIMETFSQVQIAPATGTHNQIKPDLKVRVRGLGQTSTHETHISYENHVDQTQYQIHEAQYQNYQADQAGITLHTPLAVEQVAQDITIPEQEVIRVNQQPQQADGAYTTLATPQDTTDAAYIDNNTLVPIDQGFATTATAETTFNSQLPFPEPPTEPNKLVGMVLTQSNDLINDAVVEIKNETGGTIRAVKTNALGQFFITTPLPDGRYIIVTQKDDFTFTPIDLQLEQSVVNPIEIRSTT